MRTAGVAIGPRQVLLTTPYITSKTWQGGQGSTLASFYLGPNFTLLPISPIKWDNNYLSLTGIAQELNVIAKQSTWHLLPNKKYWPHKIVYDHSNTNKNVHPHFMDFSSPFSRWEWSSHCGECQNWKWWTVDATHLNFCSKSVEY